MTLTKIHRTKGELTNHWIARRDEGRLHALEEQVQQLQNDFKKLQGRKK